MDQVEPLAGVVGDAGHDRVGDVFGLDAAHQEIVEIARADVGHRRGGVAALVEPGRVIGADADGDAGETRRREGRGDRFPNALLAP